MTLIPMLRRNQAVFLVAAGFLLLAACNPFGGGGSGGGTLSRSESIIATATARGPAPTPTPTVPAEPTATPFPTPTPTPSPTVARALAESLVWSEVSSCAEQVASPGAAEGGGAVAAETVDVSVVFESSYDAVNLRWIVDVVTNDDRLSFGQWAVADVASPSATPRDATAGRIAAGITRCALPNALLDDVPTPPLFLPADPLVPAAVTAEEASILTWVASYDCFTPHPLFGAFVTRVEDPRRWVVEGRGTQVVEVEVTVETGSGTETFTETRTETAFYGLWLVDTETGQVTGADILAAAMARDSCFKQLP
ncbi:MAG: hypothetical protein IIC94_05295 [Chloroflexi bacterium]|nr:hypothetical protein [Chloroflexota bacterium]